MTILPIPPEMPPSDLLYRRVYVRTRDLFGEVVGLTYAKGQAIPRALVRLEGPWAADVDPEPVDLDGLELVSERPPNPFAADGRKPGAPSRLLVSLPDVPTDRRFAWLLISGDLFVEVFKGFQAGGLRAFVVEECALPVDARAIGYRFRSDGILALLLHSRVFEPIPHDAQTPVLPPPVLRVVPAAIPKRQDRGPR